MACILLTLSIGTFRREMADRHDLVLEVAFGAVTARSPLDELAQGDPGLSLQHRRREHLMQRPQLIKLFRDLASEIAEKDLSFLQEEHSISDLGIDSLAMLELVGSMERELRIRVPDESLVGLQTVRQLLELVEGRMPQTA